MARRVAVVGGGISGLAAAWQLAGAGDEVVLFESAPRLGGKLRVESVAGLGVDVGAEAMLARRPEGVGLLAELGLTPIAPLTTQAALRAGGVLHPLPARTLLGVPADLDALEQSGVLTPHAFTRVAAEPGKPPLAPLDQDVSVGDLVRMRLGNEVADRLVEPLLAGVYAGQADRLSLRATIPALAAALRDGGSLVEAAQSVVAAQSAAALSAAAQSPGTQSPGTQSSAAQSPAPVFASVAGGLGSLPAALAASGRFEVRTGTTVRTVRHVAGAFLLDCGAVPSSYSITVDAVVVAVPAPKAAWMLTELVPGAAAELAAIDTASMAIVTFALKDVELPAGSGLLIGASEGLAVKGVTISSQKWPLDSNGLTLLRASVGRAGEPQVLQRTDENLIGLVRHELAELLGVTAEPVDVIVTRWGGGLPQYGVGHVERIARIRAAVAAIPGLAICGAAFDGVGVPACIASARKAVASLGD